MRIIEKKLPCLKINIYSDLFRNRRFKRVRNFPLMISAAQETGIAVKNQSRETVDDHRQPILNTSSQV